MTSAPALVMLAHGSDHPAEEEVARHLCRRLQSLRPTLSISLAFLDPGSPSGGEEVDRLVEAGFGEIVFIPLDLSRAVEADETTTTLLAFRSLIRCTSSLSRRQACSPRISFNAMGIREPLPVST